MRLHRGWEIKRGISAQISTSAIDDIYAKARDAGALGGKLAGAGGGGFLLLYCPKHAQARSARGAQRAADVWNFVSIGEARASRSRNERKVGRQPMTGVCNHLEKTIYFAVMRAICAAMASFQMEQA